MSSTINSLPVPCNLKVRFFNSLEEHCLYVKEMKPVGQSYKATRTHDGSLETLFLKAPDLTSAERRDALRDRFWREMQRGEELNALIDMTQGVSSTCNKIGDDFELPRFVGAGVILSVTVKKDRREMIYEWDGMPFILYKWLEGRQLDHVVYEGKKDALTLRANWFSFARGITRVVKRLHNFGFLHASITPSNIIYHARRRKLYLAGFGYASLCIDDATHRPAGESETEYKAPEVMLHRSLDALWHAADIYSIGVVLLFLATAARREFLQEIKAAGNLGLLKKIVRDGIEDNNDGIQIFKNDNIAKIIDNCVRVDPSDRFETAEELLGAIDIAETRPSVITKRSGKTKSIRAPLALPSLDSLLEKGPFFLSLYEHKYRELLDLHESIANRAHYEIYGSRKNIIEGLCRMVGSLPNDAVYRTVSLPSYWTNKNLGPDGRFLAMNRNVARRGVRVERIFLVSGPMHTLPDHEQEIIRRQAQVSDGPLQVRVRITSAEEVFNFERSGQAVAFIAFDARDLKGPQALQRKIGRYLCLNFISRGQEKVHYGKPVIERQIRKIRIWDPARGESFFEKFTREAEEFERLWDLPTSQKASDYIKRSGGISLDSLLANFQSAQPTGV